MTIILADQDTVFTQQLSAKIRQRLTDAAIVTINDAQQIESSRLDLKEPHLMIRNPASVSNLDAERFDRHFKIDEWLLVEHGIDPAIFRFARLGPQTDLIAAIDVWSRQNSGQLDPHSDDIETDSFDRTPLVHFLFSADSQSLPGTHSRQRLNILVEQGHKVIYLPLMPTYQMVNIQSNGSGLGLSDLLVRLLDPDFPCSEIGHFLQPHPDGYLQIRPPDRSDDLVGIEKPLARRLISGIRQFAQLDADQTKVLIDCAGLPIETTKAIAVLCDICEIILPVAANTFAANAAKRESSDLLAELPSTCQILYSDEL